MDELGNICAVAEVFGGDAVKAADVVPIEPIPEFTAR
jgi:hypothetical protein